MKRICALDSSLNGELKIVRGDGTFSVMGSSGRILMKRKA